MFARILKNRNNPDRVLVKINGYLGFFPHRRADALLDRAGDVVEIMITSVRHRIDPATGYPFMTPVGPEIQHLLVDVVEPHHRKVRLDGFIRHPHGCQELSSGCFEAEPWMKSYFSPGRTNVYIADRVNDHFCKIPADEQEPQRPLVAWVDPNYSNRGTFRLEGLDSVEDLDLHARHALLSIQHPCTKHWQKAADPQGAL